ncbi:hypothetical protein [Bradyrhizobium sp. CSS354]|nr:hypothetical protein [Bradyrhizobium sp. CSS354]MDE5465446.1 hypothetical protein [Bradyrhizobium sp. CSS354]
MSALLSIFGVAATAISRLETAHRASRQPTANGFDRGFEGSKGLAMLIRGQIDGISGEVALAAATIPAALLPTLLIGGLLLTCP